MKESKFFPEVHRALPNSLDAEKGFLGCILYAASIRGVEAGRSLMFSLEGRVSSAFFHLPAHRTIWKAIKQMHRDNDPLDFITLTEFLESSGYLESVGGAQAVTELFSFVPTDANVEEYLSILKEKHGLRVIATLSTSLTGESQAPNATPEQIAASAIASLQAVIDSSSDQKKSRLSMRTITELMHMEFDDSDNYFGDRVIAASQPLTILGPGGIGKSRLLMQLAFCMITGRPFLDIETHAKGKKWLIFQTENSNRRIKEDIAKMMRGMRFQKEDVQLIDECFAIHTIEKDEDTFLDLETDEIKHIQQAIADYDPHFVAFDPLNTFTSLELNNDRDMKTVITALSRAVKRGNPQRVPIVVHHSATGKAGAAKAVGWDKSSFGRNSKALYAWTRAQINLAPQDPDNPSMMIMACGKNNNGAHFPEMGVMMDEKSGIYQINPDFDPEEFRQNVGIEKRGDSKKIAMTGQEVAGLFDDQIDRKTLIKGIMAEKACSQATAYRVLGNAEKQKSIIRLRASSKLNPIYQKPDPQTSFHDAEND